jgi:hypothetical protein
VPKGKTIADLVQEIKNGDAYVNVHTVQHPAGEIRGQIETPPLVPEHFCPVFGTAREGLKTVPFGPGML